MNEGTEAGSVAASASHIEALSAEAFAERFLLTDLSRRAFHIFEQVASGEMSVREAALRMAYAGELGTFPEEDMTVDQIAEDYEA